MQSSVAGNDDVVLLDLVDKPGIIDKTPRFCLSPLDMQAGDLVIFNDDYLRRTKRKNAGGKPGVPRKNITGFFTKRQQALLNEPGGHMDSLHAGIIVEINGVKKLAHLLGKGFQLEDIDPDSEADAKFLHTTTHIYRPTKNQDKISAKLTEIIQDLHPEDREKKKSTKVKWALITALRSVVHRIFSSLRIKYTDPDKKILAERDIPPLRVIANESICSKFDADIYIAICHALTQEDGKNYRARYMNISSFTVPKTLQAYLYRNANYEYLVMPNRREDVFIELEGRINLEITRLAKDALPKAKEKAAELQLAMAAFKRTSSADEDLMQKSIRLLKELAPILLINTRGHLSTPTSYKNVMAFARTQAIYPEYLQHDFYDRHHGKISALAEQHYHYSRPLAKLYSQYRHLGYSDVEAKFESNPAPKFGDWYKLSPARNILLTCSIVGFFGWVLPRGLSRAREVARRNQARLHDHALEQRHQL